AFSFASLPGSSRQSICQSLYPPRPGRLGLEAAILADRAAPAFGLARLADIAAVQDQPVMGMEHESRRHLLLQSLFHFERGLAGGEAGAVADAEEMGIHRGGGLLEPDIDHHIGGLAADAGQGCERLAILGHFAAMLVDEDLREGMDILGLAAKQAEG